jgi:origin recognition complex subunit 4
MAKRKASIASLPTEPTRRRLRSSNVVVDPPAKLSAKRCTRRTREGSSSVASTSIAKEERIRTYDSKRESSLQRIEPPHSQGTSSIPPADEYEADELNLLPVITQSPRPSTPSKRTPRREIMHSVDIITPKHFTRVIGSLTNSPRSYSRDRLLKAKETKTTGLVLDPTHVTLSPLYKRVLVPPATSPVVLGDRSARVLLPAVVDSVVAIPVVLPSKQTVTQNHSPTQLPGTLPPHLHSCLHTQRTAIMAALRNPPDLNEDDSDDDQNVSSTNLTAYENICDLLIGTIKRGEGNSCMIIGPRGSGKTRVSLPSCVV